MSAPSVKVLCSSHLTFQNLVQIQLTNNILCMQQPNTVSRLTVQTRSLGYPQPESGAVIYLLHILYPLLCSSPEAHAGICMAGIRQPLRLFHVEGRGTLVLIVDILLPGSLKPQSPAEVRAQSQDLTLLRR